MQKMSTRKPVNQGQDVNENRFVTANLLPNICTSSKKIMIDVNFDKMSKRSGDWQRKEESPDYKMVDTELYKFPKSKVTKIKPLVRNRSQQVL